MGAGEAPRSSLAPDYNIRCAPAESFNARLQPSCVEFHARHKLRTNCCRFCVVPTHCGACAKALRRIGYCFAVKPMETVFLARRLFPPADALQNALLAVDAGRSSAVGL